MPGATDAICAFVNRAAQHHVERIVLLSGRGEEEAQACERIVQESGLDWTIVRASWFHQNFSEGAFVDMVQAGQITLPVGKVAEPFIDADDIADVSAELSRACNREIALVPIPHDAFVDEVARSGAPKEAVWMLNHLFATVLDGRNASLTDGIPRALGRPPKDFAAYAREVAATGAWNEFAPA